MRILVGLLILGISGSAFAQRGNRGLDAKARQIVIAAEDLAALTRQFGHGQSSVRELRMYLNELEARVDDYKKELSPNGIVYTTEIFLQGRSGNLIASYDDYRGGVAGISISDSINNLCRLAGKSGGQGGELEGRNYGCATREAPTAYCSNGRCTFYPNFVARGQGWCAHTAIEWIACAESGGRRPPPGWGRGGR